MRASSKHNVRKQTQRHGESHIRQCTANWDVQPHQQTVEHKADQPDGQVPPVIGCGRAVSPLNEVVCNLYGDHGGEHGANQIQKAGNVVHGKENGAENACGGHCDGGGPSMDVFAE